MKKTKRLNTILPLCWLFLLPTMEIWAQKLDTDSLVQVIANDYKLKLPYRTILQKALLGKRIAPNYLDFHLFAGRMHQLLKNQDSARYYFQYVLDRNPKYFDAYPYWIQIEMQNRNYTKAESLVELGLEHFNNNAKLLLKKAEILQIYSKDTEELAYLYSIQHQFPANKAIQQRIFYLEGKINHQYFGATYTNTTFDNAFVGPWNMVSLSYGTIKKWGTAVGRVTYLDRRGIQDLAFRGTQYEVDLYFNTFKNQYFNANIAFSDNVVFPEIRVGGNYYFSFLKSWEINVGHRYTKTAQEDFTSLVFGAGKYLGNFWLKGDYYKQKFEKQYFNSYFFTSRYYYGNRFDYAQFILGFGTSPDDKNTVGLLQNRIALQSRRVGLGIQKTVSDKYVIALLSNYNHQEVIPSFFQNELEITLRLQYLF